MDYIRRSGNNVAYSNRKLGRDEAMLCLENLFIYLDYIACCYSKQYKQRTFDKSIITARMEKAKGAKEAAKTAKEELLKQQEQEAKQQMDLKKLMAENVHFGKNSQPEDKPSRSPMFQSRLIIQNIRRENYTLMLCSWMQDGQKAKTGSMR